MMRLGVFLLAYAIASSSACVPFGVNIDPSSVSVSGISAGAAMATQYHVAHSASVVGIGLFAGPGPYYCAESSVTFALGRCMVNPENIPTLDLITLTTELAIDGSIDSPTNLNGDNVYIFQGTVDDVVAPPVADTLVQYYNAFAANVVIENSLTAGHGQPTVDQGNACSSSAEPYINRCNYDGAFEALNYIYGGNLVRPDGVIATGTLSAFDQGEHVPNIGGPTSISLADDGYIYIPSGCQDGVTECKLHVAFHGCLQNYGSVGDAYVSLSGYNEVGEANNIVILYPQTVRSLGVPYNPNGCFDWWGYNDPALNAIYHTKVGDHMMAIESMIDCLINGS